MSYRNAWTRRRVLLGAGAVAAAGIARAQQAKQAQVAGTLPVLLGLSAAFSVREWTAPAAIQAGITIACEEINERGGVLGGRPLQLITEDHRSMAARAARSVETFAGTQDLVAMFCDGYSPAALEMVRPAQHFGLPLLDPWSAADAITDHGQVPSYTFRLSLRDSWVMPVLLRSARERGLRRLGMMAVSSGWGRANEDALRAALTQAGGRQSLVGVQYHAPDATVDDLTGRMAALRVDGAEVIVLVGAVADSCRVISLMRSLPADQRRPILSHWGVLAGDYERVLRTDLQEVDVRVVQTFSEHRAASPRARAVLKRARSMLGTPEGASIPSVGGVAHAYDLTHMLAAAIERAGTLRRDDVRASLEQLPSHPGLTKQFVKPFRNASHDALSPSDVFIARLLPAAAHRQG